MKPQKILLLVILPAWLFACTSPQKESAEKVGTMTSSEIRDAWISKEDIARHAEKTEWRTGNRFTEKLRIVVFGAHPDDPEAAAGGLIASLTESGHEVIVAYGTAFRGDRKFFGRPEAEVRRKEGIDACRVLGAKPKFFDYAHEKLFASESTLHEISIWLDDVKPDIVVTHWPLDMHPNHHVISSAIWQAYQRNDGWNLYFFEAMTGQTISFYPELYFDIQNFRAIKKEALFRHKSQNLEETWEIHEAMHRRRGRECGVNFSEAYYLVEAKPDCALLPVKFLSKKSQ